MIVAERHTAKPAGNWVSQLSACVIPWPRLQAQLWGFVSVLPCPSYSLSIRMVSLISPLPSLTVQLSHHSLSPSFFPGRRSHGPSLNPGTSFGSIACRLPWGERVHVGAGSRKALPKEGEIAPFPQALNQTCRCQKGQGAFLPTAG